MLTIPAMSRNVLRSFGVPCSITNLQLNLGCLPLLFGLECRSCGRITSSSGEDAVLSTSLHMSTIDLPNVFGNEKLSPLDASPAEVVSQKSGWGGVWVAAMKCVRAWVEEGVGVRGEGGADAVNPSIKSC